MTLNVLTLLSYGVVLGALAFSPPAWVWGLLPLAWLLHAVVLHAWIDGPLGQNLSPVHLISVVFWLVTLFSGVFYGLVGRRMFVSFRSVRLRVVLFCSLWRRNPHGSDSPRAVYAVSYSLGARGAQRPWYGRVYRLLLWPA